MSTTLEAETVSRIYGGRTVVNEVSLSLSAGQTTALLGQSGAGKSTLLRLFAGFERLDTGTIRRNGQILSARNRHIAPEKRQIGMIFQDFALFPHLDATANTGFALTHLSGGARKKTATHWLERLGLGHRTNAYPHELSGGEQQRVSIARALAAEPVALLMDEPFSGLDPSLREEVRTVAFEAIREAGIPCLLVTHDASEALAVADRVAVMKDGVLLQEGTPDELYLAPQTLSVAEALGPVAILPVAAMPQAWRTKLNGHLLDEPEAVYLRPEALRATRNSEIRLAVKSARRMPGRIEVEFEFPDGSRAKGVSLGARLPREGDAMTVEFDPAFGFDL